jgi:transcriptional regulator with XRE-family HTH domain
MVKRKMIEFRHDRLLTLLEANHMNVQELADKVGVTRQLVYRWLNGQSLPGIKPLIRLCELYRVDMNFFFPAMRKTKLEAVLV